MTMFNEQESHFQIFFNPPHQEIIYQEHFTGAQQDFTRASALVKNTHWSYLFRQYDIIRVSTEGALAFV